ncbi:amino acid permease [Colletotrichum cuscutae]|uniref:Amino acid permease n=1 Tax=Colletotrichum cuscutae TaxID=1209917 RepID=A0AAI9UHP2_9PEZI|nr:amino acid permease [Colletotrichum cuscutae]
MLEVILSSWLAARNSDVYAKTRQDALNEMTFSPLSSVSSVLTLPPLPPSRDASSSLSTSCQPSPGAMGHLGPSVDLVYHAPSNGNASVTLRIGLSFSQELGDGGRRTQGSVVELCFKWYYPTSASNYLYLDDLKKNRSYQKTVGLSPRDCHYGETQPDGYRRFYWYRSLGSYLEILIHLDRSAGPLSLVLGYTFWGLLFIWPLNLSVAEMCAYLPIRGTIFELASRFVDPALSFAMGWTYFFAGLMLVCTEYSAVATVIQYWNADINPAAWIAVAMVSCVAVNLVAVKYYGESEFIMASTKVILLIGLCLITLITMSGGNPMNDAYGFRNWGDGNYIHAYFTDGSTGRFLGFWKVVIYAAFTIAGPDMIALAAGEIQNPRRTIPRVAKLIFYRLVGFYVVGVLCVGIICSSRDPGLLGAIESGEPGAGASPWVVGIKNLHIKALPDIINAFILLSGWSCGNAYLYSTSRTLYGLARDGQAPKFLLKCTKAGVPIYSVLVVTVISCITFLVSSNSAVDVFFWFVDLTTTALIMTYTFMLITYMGFYRARMAQNFPPETLPYLSPWTPYFPGLALLLGILTLIFVGFDNFYPFSVRGFITSYFGLIFGVVTFLIWKVLKRTRFVHPKEADLISGKAEVDAECRHWEEGGIEEENLGKDVVKVAGSITIII